MMTHFDHAYDLGANLSRSLGAAAVEGLWPWRGETVDIFSDYDIDFNTERITVEIRSSKWDKYLFYGRVELPRDVLLNYPDGEGWLDMTCDFMTRCIRNRKVDHPILANIILGEN